MERGASVGGRVGHASFLENVTSETTLMGLRRESYSDRHTLIGKARQQDYLVSRILTVCILFSLPFISFLPFCHPSSSSPHHGKLRFNKVEEYKFVAEESLLRLSLPCYRHCLEGSTMFSA